MGRLIQNKHDYFYICPCGGKPVYIMSEWFWGCPVCGASNSTYYTRQDVLNITSGKKSLNEVMKGKNTLTRRIKYYLRVTSCDCLHKIIAKKVND